MTVCLYISPQIEAEPTADRPLPVIMADSLVSFRGVPAESSPVLPTTFRAGQNVPSSVTLSRKLNIVGDTAIAMAGDVEPIEELLKEVSIKVAAGERDEGLISVIRRYADLLNERNLTKRVHVLATRIKHFEEGENAGGQAINTASLDPGFETEQLGRCSIIGSGGDDVKEMCLRFNRAERKAPGLERAMVLLGALNGERLGRELAGGVKDYGGYMEMAYLPPNHGWTRGPRSLHLFYAAIPAGDDENSFTLASVPRILLYDPGSTHGRILGIHGTDQGVDSKDFTLRNIAEPRVPGTQAEFWSGFKPRIVTLTIVNMEEGGRLLTDVYVDPNPELFQFEIEVLRANALRLLLRDEALVDRLGQNYSRGGYTYRPAVNA